MKKKAGTIATVAMAITLPLSTMTAFAGTTASHFDTKYQQNLTTESTLLQQAQASTVSNADTQSLSQIVSTLNETIAAMYTSEQTLVQAKSGIPQQTADHKLATEVNKLQTRQTDLLKKSNAAWQLVAKYTKSHSKNELQLAIKTHERIQRQLNEVNHDLGLAKGLYAHRDWKAHPYAGGIPKLQQSILDMQTSVIHYTKEWLADETTVTPTTVTPTTVTPTTVTPSTASN